VVSVSIQENLWKLLKSYINQKQVNVHSSSLFKKETASQKNVTSYDIYDTNWTEYHKYSLQSWEFNATDKCKIKTVISV